MKKKILPAIALLGFLICSFAVATGITGKWSGTLSTPGGDYPLTYILKADSGKITGTATSPQGDVPITNGKTDGTNFTFNLSVNGTDLKHTGKYYAAADTIGLDVDYMGNVMHTTLKRADK